MNYAYYKGMCFEVLPDGSYRRVKRGRVPGSGRYGEACLSMEIPFSLVNDVAELLRVKMEEASKHRPTALNPFFTTPGFDPDKIVK